MRVLFVAPYLPTPGSGGRTRLMNLMARHAQRHELSLVALAPPDQDPAESPYPGATVPYVPPKRPTGLAGSVAFYRERFAQPLPAFAYSAKIDGFADAIRREVARSKPDLVQFEHPETGQYVPAVPRSVARVMDFHDVASRWLAREAAKPIAWRYKALFAIDLLKCRRYERGIARTVDASIVCSPLERDELVRIAGVDPLVAPNGVDATYFSPMPEIVEDPNRLLYVGPMKYAANSDAVGWFSREILPRIREQVENAYLDVVGLPSAEVFPNGVKQLGKVSDIRPEYARASILVVPIRAGAGTRYKILEALAMGRAVVSTSLGAEGLGAEHDKHLVIADDPASFSEAVVELIRAPRKRAELGQAGRAFVSARFDWAPIVASIEERWEAARRRRAPS